MVIAKLDFCDGYCRSACFVTYRQYAVICRTIGVYQSFFTQGELACPSFLTVCFVILIPIGGGGPESDTSASINIFKCKAIAVLTINLIAYYISIF